MTVGSKIKPGDIHNCWEVVRRVGGTRRVMFLCRCVCDNETEVLAQHLKSGKSTQCRSCANHQRAHLKHVPRDIYARLYHQAKGAIRRCRDESNDDYYGRGIKVHDEWAADIKIFVEYLVALPGYDDRSLVLDRVNNDGNYEPGNLRFATWSESNYNRRLPSRKEV